MQNMCQEWVEQETTEIMVWTLFLSYSLLAKLDRESVKRASMQTVVKAFDQDFGPHLQTLDAHDRGWVDLGRP